jgi:phosphatidate cytidylyltransferase
VTNFVRRTITGAFIVVFVLGGIWLHPVSFFIVGAAMIAGTQYEYYMMAKNAGIFPQVVMGMITGLAVYIISSLVAAGVIARSSFLWIILPVFIVLSAELFRKTGRPFDSLAHTFFSVLYTAVPVSLFPFAAFGHTGVAPLAAMNGVEFSPGIVIAFFLLLWTNDTGAYLVGSAAGRHRLFERLSPKKSWEGFFGGVVLTVAVSLLMPRWIGVTGRTGWMIIALIISVAGTAGDLVESMLKRSLGLKDSGTVMPGHGGFLDRFDSVVVSFPLVYLFITFAG